MMDQTHIGYVYWQQLDKNKTPELKYRPSGDSFLGKEIVATTYPIVFETNAESNGFFVEKDGVVFIEAAYFSKNNKGQTATWKEVPGLSRTLSGMTLFPVTSNTQTPQSTAPELQYVFHADFAGDAKLELYFAPTLNFQHSPIGLRVAVAIDDEKPQIIAINQDDANLRVWQGWVSNNIIMKSTSHKPSKQETHIVHIRAMDPGLVFQKMVLDLGGLKPSYLSAPETIKYSK